ncbi:sphingomyelin phosphodiesterase-like [Harmonia axyridis]|uniref:sphingomyelin phosphodiesterase-like n=1 Tax=Harmonia axyridis TaxID=115357 RepID=UPI001E279136|nr:sphingomyelin phosphodiesterase-like [Harmonia axyridis]
MRSALLIVLFFVASFERCKAADDIQLLKNGLDNFLHTGVLSQYMKNISKNHQIDISFFKEPSIENLSAEITCDVCDGFIESVITLRKLNTSDATMKSLIKRICSTFHIQDQQVCDGLLGPMLDVIFYIMDNGKNVTGPKLCSLLLGPTCHNQFEFYNWTISVPPKPAVIPKKISGAEKVRILHLTDMHVDPRYTSGSKAVCDQTLCCQDDQGKPENSTAGCGVWGDYKNADTPMKLLEETLRHLKTEKFDYVYSTGDIIPHRIWSTSREGNAALELKVMKLLRDSFQVPILFVLGNHEPHPLNMYAPIDLNKTNLSTKWLYETLHKEESIIFPESDLDSIQEGGFYTVLLKTGFRVIVLNNNVCYLNNYWLAYDDYDPYGQLAWLVKVLQKAEEDGEYVHIVYHVPTGQPESCLGTWAREYNKIVNRFSDTISGQFNGHTHADEFFVYYNETNPTDAIQVAFNGGSLTPFVETNPSYKIYDVNMSNCKVEDFEEWTFNLTEANLKPEKSTVDWYKLYSFKETYGVPSLEPKEVGKLVDNMARNKTLLEIYNKFKYTMGSRSYKPCDDKCHKENLCNIVTNGLGDDFHCSRISEIYDDSQ